MASTLLYLKSKREEFKRIYNDLPENNKRRDEITKHIQDMTVNVDSTVKSSLVNSPFPLIIMETSGNIIWKSSKFVSEFANIDINQITKNLAKEIKLDILESKLNKEERKLNIQGVYELKNEQIITNKKILLIDDIYTTGATVNECAKVLKQQNCNVSILTIAKDL